MSKVKVGQVFGELCVVSLYRKSRGDGFFSNPWAYMAECLCSCGETKHCERGNLKLGRILKCDRCSAGSLGGVKAMHGHSFSAAGSGTVEAKCYYTWQAMKRRCMVPTDKKWNDYGGRGISVCQQWVQSYPAFLNDMGLPPSMDHQIDRADNNGNYCKDNCSWVTASENGRNKRTNKLLTAFGRTMTQAAWAEETGIKRETISMRLSRGYSAEEALNAGGGRVSKKTYTVDGDSFASIKAAADHHNLSVSGAHSRFKSDKYPCWVSN